jgi:hypothetical protein
MRSHATLQPISGHRVLSWRDDDFVDLINSLGSAAIKASTSADGVRELRAAR